MPEQLALLGRGTPVINNTSLLFSTNDITRMTLSQHPFEEQNKYSNFKSNQHPFEIVINSSSDAIFMIYENTHFGSKACCMFWERLLESRYININMNLSRQEKILKNYIDYYK